MSKSIYLKNKEELLPQELMAYTLAKLGSYAWSRTEMYKPNRIYERPAGFYFRFHDADQVYEQLKPCIEEFKGNLKWIIHVSPVTRHQNYVVEPADVYYAKQAETYQVNMESWDVLQRRMRTSVNWQFKIFLYYATILSNGLSWSINNSIHLPYRISE